MDDSSMEDGPFGDFNFTTAMPIHNAPLEDIASPPPPIPPAYVLPPPPVYGCKLLEIMAFGPARPVGEVHRFRNDRGHVRAFALEAPDGRRIPVITKREDTIDKAELEVGARFVTLDKTYPLRALSEKTRAELLSPSQLDYHQNSGFPINIGRSWLVIVVQIDRLQVLVSTIFRITTSREPKANASAAAAEAPQGDIEVDVHVGEKRKADDDLNEAPGKRARTEPRPPSPPRQLTSDHVAEMEDILFSRLGFHGVDIFARTHTEPHNPADIDNAPSMAPHLHIDRPHDNRYRVIPAQPWSSFTVTSIKPSGLTVVPEQSPSTPGGAVKEVLWVLVNEGILDHELTLSANFPHLGIYDAMYHIIFSSLLAKAAAEPRNDSDYSDDYSEEVDADDDRLMIQWHPTPRELSTGGEVSHTTRENVQLRQEMDSTAQTATDTRPHAQATSTGDGMQMEQTPSVAHGTKRPLEDTDVAPPQPPLKRARSNTMTGAGAGAAAGAGAPHIQTHLTYHVAVPSPRLPPPRTESLTDFKFRVHCVDCKGHREGKLRARCAKCKEGAIEVLGDPTNIDNPNETVPQSWERVTNGRFRGMCHTCGSEQEVKHYMRCGECKDESVTRLNLVIPVPSEASGENRNCQICMAPPADGFLLRLPCGCQYCVATQSEGDSCFKNFVKSQLNNVNHAFMEDLATRSVTIRCATEAHRNSTISEVKHMKMAGTELYELFKERAAVKLVEGRCPWCNMGMIDIEPRKNAHPASCPGCSKPMCIKEGCFQRWEDVSEHVCEDEAAAAARALGKPCPGYYWDPVARRNTTRKCTNIVIHNFGARHNCHHMMGCEECGAHFCYRCLRVTEACRTECNHHSDCTCPIYCYGEPNDQSEKSCGCLACPGCEMCQSEERVHHVPSAGAHDTMEHDSALAIESTTLDRGDEVLTGARKLLDRTEVRDAARASTSTRRRVQH